MNCCSICFTFSEERGVRRHVSRPRSRGPYNHSTTHDEKGTTKEGNHLFGLTLPHYLHCQRLQKVHLLIDTPMWAGERRRKESTWNFKREQTQQSRKHNDLTVFSNSALFISYHQRQPWQPWAPSYPRQHRAWWLYHHPYHQIGPNHPCRFYDEQS